MMIFIDFGEFCSLASLTANSYLNHRVSISTLSFRETILRAYPKPTFVMKASEIVPGKDESKKCLKACLWHVEGIFCLKTKPGTIAADCNRRWF
ncbi:MAG: hypothetical protein OXB88_01400 [Bacteriovoracales bacterium]|nr:hypothetical protein [Bacteriovoracales bacterium]